MYLLSNTAWLSNPITKKQKSCSKASTQLAGPPHKQFLCHASNNILQPDSYNMRFLTVPWIFMLSLNSMHMTLSYAHHLLEVLDFVTSTVIFFYQPATVQDVLHEKNHLHTHKRNCAIVLLCRILRSKERRQT